MKRSYLLSWGALALASACGQGAGGDLSGPARQDESSAPVTTGTTQGTSEGAQDLPRRPERPLTIGSRAQELERIQAFINDRVDPADIVSSYFEDDGTAVDCVKIENQP